MKLNTCNLQLRWKIWLRGSLRPKLDCNITTLIKILETELI